MLRKLILSGLLVFIVSLASVRAQDAPLKPAGMVSVGTRTIGSLFNGGDGNSAGIGLGGQTRIQFSRKVNSEWFFDYITSRVDNAASRNDFHGGWSLMFYPGNTDFTHLLQPYILAGHCFDYTRIVDDKNPANYGERSSMAMQAGLGSHFNVTPRFDFSLSAQYMLHLGEDIHTSVVGDRVVFSKTNFTKPEGHLLLSLSINYKLFNLW